MTPAHRKRAMTSEKASRVKIGGHEKEKEFAELIGGTVGNPQNNPQGKGDVIDQNGDVHSVKGAELKWQIFLYGRNRFKNNTAFHSMGIRDLFLACIDAFPPSREDYCSDKQKYKNKLRAPMRLLCENLTEPRQLKSFLHKSFFNDKVKYLTVKNDRAFHVFLNDDVTDILTSNIRVMNSQARHAKQTSEQKVIFRSQKTLGEIEMRNDSDTHYREIKFWMLKAEILIIIQKNIDHVEEWVKGRLFVYGKAINCFAPKHKPSL